MRRVGCALVVLAGFAACRTAPDRGGAKSNKLEVSLVFVEPDHRLAACQKELGGWLLDNPDSVLFWSPDSKIRVTPPRPGGASRYHAHLFHRVGQTRAEWVGHQDKDGLIEVPIGRFDEPEALVITSAARRYSRADSDGEGPSERNGPSEAITPPYTLSFKLVSAELAETILPLQRHRFEIRTPVGTLFFLSSSFNRKDQLLTWVDPRRKLSALIEEDPYIHLRSHDGVIVPRVRVDVLSTKTGNLWQRAGTWHLPETIDRPGNKEERPFALRTAKRELISFGPPPTLDLDLPDEPPGTSAPVGVRFKGVGPEDALTFALAAAYPAGPKGEYAFRIQTDTITADKLSRTYSCSLDHLDVSSFPLVSALTHRLRTPWVLTGGRYAPVPPRGTATVPLVSQAAPRGLHARIVSPRYASHFDLIEFLGEGRMGKKGSSVLDDYLGRPPGDGPDDPNLVPPPPGGPPGGGIVPPPPTIPPPPGGDDGGGGQRDPLRGLGGIGGGGNSNCGCGQNGMNCPDATNPCKGTCGQGCPGNGHCKPNGQAGVLKVVLPCPPKGKSCGKMEAECKCPPHPWNFTAVLGALQAWFIPQGAADVDWHGIHGATGACHQWTYVADARVFQWVGIRQVSKMYRVYVTFKPCIPLLQLAMDDKEKKKDDDYDGPKDDKPDPDGDTALAEEGGSSGSPLTGATFTLDLTDVSSSISTTSGFYNDPDTALAGQVVVDTFSGIGKSGSFQSQSSNFVPAGTLALDGESLSNIVTAHRRSLRAFTFAYWNRPLAPGLLGSDGLNPLLVQTWGVYQPGVATAGGTAPPPVSPPPPTCDPADYYNCPTKPR